MPQLGSPPRFCLSLLFSPATSRFHCHLLSSLPSSQAETVCFH